MATEQTDGRVIVDVIRRVFYLTPDGHVAIGLGADVPLEPSDVGDERSLALLVEILSADA